MLRRMGWLVLWLAFTVWSVGIVVRDGFGPLVEGHMRGGWGSQVFVDLILACGFSIAWIRKDAAERRANAWPFIVAVPFLGSIATLAYLVAREFGWIGRTPSEQR